MAQPTTKDHAKVSVVFVTYDRLETLKPTVESFLSLTNYPRDRLELIVSDDASPSAVQREFEKLAVDRIVIGETRSGIGANQNRGMAASTGEYILQIQDDWLCQGPPDYLSRALAALESRPEVGMVILNEHPMNLPVRTMTSVGGHVVRIYDNFPNKRIKIVGENAYTDWPHLKRREFHQKLGLYKEGVHMATCELDFSRRVNLQQSYFIADVVGLNVFKHIGAHLSYNTNTVPARIVKKLERIPGGALATRMLRSFAIFGRT